MGFKNRIGVIMRSQIGDLVTRAEDPQKIINHMVEEMDEGLRKAKAKITALKYRVEQEETLLERIGEQTSAWQERARGYIEKSMDENAKEAIRKKRILENEARRVSEDLTRDKVSLGEFEERYQDLDRRVTEAKSRRTVLLRNYVLMQETGQRPPAHCGGAAEFEEAFSVYNKMEDRINEERDLLTPAADSESERRRAEERMIEEEFESLKKDMGKGGSKK